MERHTVRRSCCRLRFPLMTFTHGQCAADTICFGRAVVDHPLCIEVTRHCLQIRFDVIVGAVCSHSSSRQVVSGVHTRSP